VDAFDAEKYEAVQAERDEYKAKLAAIEAETAQKARLDMYGAKLQEAKVVLENGAEMLASMTDEQADWVIERFRALGAQVEESELFSEKGTSGEALPEDPKQRQAELISQYAAANNVTYHAAYMAVSRENPELFK
jgi:hypothetical protein